MTTDMKTVAIVPLNETNYATWKFIAKWLLYVGDVLVLAEARSQFSSIIKIQKSR